MTCIIFFCIVIIKESYDKLKREYYALYLNNNHCRLSKEKTGFFRRKISNFAIVLVLSNC